MRVKLDEDLSDLVGQPLQDAGHSVLSVAGQGWSGLKDADLWQRMLAEKIFFVTADKGFGDIRVYPSGSHAGILVLRPDRESIIEYQALLCRTIEKHSLEKLAACITVATPRSIRTRRPPVS